MDKREEKRKEEEKEEEEKRRKKEKKKRRSQVWNCEYLYEYTCLGLYGNYGSIEV